MNNIYQYEYKSNGKQFASFATPDLMATASSLRFNPEVPKVIAVWKYKKMNAIK